MLDVDFIIILIFYYILCMVRQLALVHWYRLQYSNVCSSMMSVHPKGGSSARDTGVLLNNVDMVSGLVKCCWMSPFPMVRGSLQVVTALFYVIVILYIQLGTVADPGFMDRGG